MRSAGTEKSSTSIVRHVGRRSGRIYETPVVAVEHDDGLLIALPYGERTDWMKNVLASGQATVVTHGRTYGVDQPQVVPMTEATRYFGPKEQNLHRRFAVDSCLQVHRMAPQLLGGRVKEAQRDYPIETFDPLLRDLVCWRLVTRQEGTTGTWQLVPRAQQRLDELLPTGAPGAVAVIYLDHLCADCHQPGPTRIHEEFYLCDRCWAERQGHLNAVVTEPPPVQQTHFWRRSR
jgi:deazaflavin-dependent oxidoreductase (nitroreductase family)